MPSSEELIKYIGREYNDEVRAEIESKFKPCKLFTCSVDDFRLEYIIFNGIRCAVEDGKITLLKFG